MKMKLAVAVVGLLLLTSTWTQAQVAIGAKAGLNLFNVTSDDGDFETKTGFHLGMLAHVHLNDQMAFQPELLYSNQGAKTSAGGEKVNLNLNYVNVPLLFQYMFDNGFRIEAGPQIGFLTSAKVKNDGDSFDVKDNFNSIDFAIPLGVGYITASGFGVDARYNIGLSNINDGDGDNAFNRGFQIGLFYQFDTE